MKDSHPDDHELHTDIYVNNKDRNRFKERQKYVLLVFSSFENLELQNTLFFALFSKLDYIRGIEYE